MKEVRTDDLEREFIVRVCDNPQCKADLTHELPAMKGKFGQRKRIMPGVVTLTLTLRTSTGGNVQANGEWCRKCAAAGMAVLCDKLQIAMTAD